MVSQVVKSQENVSDDFSQRENTDYHLNEEEAKINPPPSSTDTSPAETEPSQAVKENHVDISEDYLIGPEKTKVIQQSSNSGISTETEQQLSSLAVNKNHENIGDSFSQEEHKEDYFLEAEKSKIIALSSSSGTSSTEITQMVSQTIKSQEKVGNGFSQRENTENHVIEMEAKISVTPSSTDTLSTEAEPSQGVKENHEDISGAEKDKNIPPSSSSCTMSTEAKQVESEEVIGDCFNEQNATKQDTGDYPTGLEETGNFPSSSSTGSLSTDTNQEITQAVKESVVDSFSPKEMV